MKLEKRDRVCQFRCPTAEDGAAVWELIRQAGTLDLNSAYCYLLLCDYFRDTCVIACKSDEIVGFLSAFRSPRQSDTLFIWQIAVSNEHRGQGIGRAMLHELLTREAVQGIRYVEATISPGNTASRGLFQKLAAELGAAGSWEKGYRQELFPQNGAEHEEEPIFRIGPLPRTPFQNKWR